MSRQSSGISRTVFAVLTVLALTVSTAAQTGVDPGLERARRATVFIYQAKTSDNALSVTCVSSGTFISADGLIITNATGIVPSRQCDGDTLIVSLSVDLNEPPIPKYRAEIASADPGLDIALLRVSRELDGRLIASGALPVLPFVEIGDSEAVAIDDNLTIVGYPGIGNDPVAITRGTVTAFLAEPLGGSHTWLKTRAEIPGTMAGGGAYNSSGQLIGVPTNAPLTGFGSSTNCRYLDDTNRDGLVNSSDYCLPVGDFISTIRPIGLAQSLIRGARLGLDVQVMSALSEPDPPMSPPRISRLFFAPSVQGQMPARVVGSLPANTRSLYLFFDYDNMTPETVYELRVTRDGIPDQVFSLPPVRWAGDENGTWYVGAREQAWANGAYEFTLLIDGASAGSQQILVGGGLDSQGHFSDIVFGTLDQSGNLIGNGSIVPRGDIAYARFLHANMNSGTLWSAIWYYRGAEFARTADTWSDQSHGAKVISVGPTGGLLPGQYRLELYVDGALSATSDFFAAGNPGAPLPRVFTNIRFASAGSPSEARLAPGASSFPTTLPILYALFDWQWIEEGTPWALRWLVDEQVFFERSSRWSSANSGADFLIALPDPPDGSYEMQLLVNNLLLADMPATIGIGQLPIDRFAQFQGTVLSGTVIDAATQKGISDITIALISEDYAASEFEWKQEQVVDLVTSDRNGVFQFPRPLAFDTPYSVVIEADGYIPLAADGFIFRRGQPNADVTIEMVRG
ncbi:MAG: trypsin-like peptidase domain-containing protein [Chloroflexi bacterium]|nr:trypsin-like peptidase domain-containing protein [Chloroflexota bacterium]